MYQAETMFQTLEVGAVLAISGNMPPPIDEPVVIVFSNNERLRARFVDVSIDEITIQAENGTRWQLTPTGKGEMGSGINVARGQTCADWVIRKVLPPVESSKARDPS